MLWLAYLLIFLYGLAHTPLVVDLLQHLLPHWNIQRLTSRTSSVILILLTVLVFLLGLGMQVFIFIPLMPEVPLRPLKLALHCVFAYWLWINAVVNYARVLFSRPGLFGPSDIKGREKRFKGTNQSDPSAVAKLRMSGPDTTACDQSHTDHQPLKSYHCKICQESIPYKDHHCPFTGNCISLANYSYFLLGIFYSMLGLWYGISVFFVYFSECFFLAWKAISVIESDNAGEVCEGIEPYGELILPSIGALVTVTLVFLFQVFLLLADVSTYELLKQWHKIRVGLREFQRKNSRFRVMFLNQRNHPIWFLVPVRNKIENPQCQG